MINNELEKLRDEVNYLIILQEYDRDELVKKSQELDKFILKSVKRQIFTSNVFGEGRVPELDDVITKLSDFQDMIDIARIVNPIKNQVLDVIDGEIEVTDFVCYSFWGRQEECDNCISIRAYEENNVQYKLEHTKDNAYIVIAIPFYIQGKKLVLELLKKIKISPSS